VRGCAGSNFILLFPQYLKLMQRNINLNNKQKHTDVMKMTNFYYIALYTVQQVAYSIIAHR